MMMRNLITAGAVFLLLGACATVEQQQVAGADQSAAKAAPAEATDGEVDMSEVVCRKEQTTGTRFAKKICRTRQEWEDAAKAGGNPIDNATRRSLQYNPEGG